MPSGMRPTVTRGSTSAAPSEPRLAMTKRRHGVEQVRRVGDPCLEPGDASSRVAAEWPADTTTPRATSEPRQVQRTGQLRRERNHAHACMTPTNQQHPRRPLPGWRRKVGSWAPERSGLMNGPSKWTPSGIAPTYPCGGPAASVASIASRRSSGEVTTVGRKLVTPNLGSLEPTSQIELGSAVKSWPKPPLSWMSISPGATMQAGSVDRLRSGGQRHLLPAIRSSRSCRPGRRSPRLSSREDQRVGHAAQRRGRAGRARRSRPAAGRRIPFRRTARRPSASIDGGRMP